MVEVAVEFDTTIAEVVAFRVGAVVFGIVVALVAGTKVSVALDGGAGITTPRLLSKARSGDTHSETRGNSALNTFCEAETALNGGGSTGSARLKARSQEMDTLASTKASGPSLMGSWRRCKVLFVNGGTDGAVGAGGAVVLVPLPQFAAILLESFASRRGSSKVAETSAFSWSRNSKPTGMEGLNARPSTISTSVILTVTGKGVSLVS